MVRILFLTHSDPASTTTESVCLRNSLLQLVNLYKPVQVEVCCSDPKDSFEQKPPNGVLEGLDFDNTSKVKVYRESSNLPSVIKFLLMLISRVCLDRAAFSTFYVWQRLKRLDLDSYQVIVLWGQWHSIFLLMPYLKERAKNTKLLAMAGDPVSGNPFVKSWVRNFNYKILENIVVKNSDIIAVKSFGYRDSLRSRIQEVIGGDKSSRPSICAKVDLLKHDAIPLELQRRTDKKDGVKFVYFGALYGGRNLIKESLLLKNLLKEIGIDPEVHVVGRVSFFVRIMHLVNRTGVRFWGFRTSDWLAEKFDNGDIFICADSPQSACLFISSKLVQLSISKVRFVYFHRCEQNLTLTCEHNCYPIQNFAVDSSDFVNWILMKAPVCPIGSDDASSYGLSFGELLEKNGILISTQLTTA